MKKDEFLYFISFQVKCVTAPIYGNALWETDEPLDNYGKILQLTKSYKKRTKKDIVILYWKRLKASTC